MNAPDVVAKKECGIHYCEVASRWAEANGQKPWKYLLIPDKSITPTVSFKFLAEKYHTVS